LSLEREIGANTDSVVLCSDEGKHKRLTYAASHHGINTKAKAERDIWYSMDDGSWFDANERVTTITDEGDAAFGSVLDPRRPFKPPQPPMATPPTTFFRRMEKLRTAEALLTKAETSHTHRQAQMDASEHKLQGIRPGRAPSNTVTKRHQKKVRLLTNEPAVLTRGRRKLSRTDLQNTVKEYRLAGRKSPKQKAVPGCFTRSLSKLPIVIAAVFLMAVLSFPTSSSVYFPALAFFKDGYAAFQFGNVLSYPIPTIDFPLLTRTNDVTGLLYDWASWESPFNQTLDISGSSPENQELENIEKWKTIGALEALEDIERNSPTKQAWPFVPLTLDSVGSTISMVFGLGERGSTCVPLDDISHLRVLKARGLGMNNASAA
jgi:hypothetical protein